MVDLLNRKHNAANDGDGDGGDARQRITVEPMQRSDVPDVMSLERRCYTLPWSASAYITEIGNSNARYLIAKQADGSLIGYGGVWVVMDEMHITTLAVDPELRGRRVGERLLINLMIEGNKLGAERATLEVREHNFVAHRLYVKYGFGDVAMRKAYYSDNRENAIIMWAEKIDAPDYRAMLNSALREIEVLHFDTAQVTASTALLHGE